MKTYRILLSIFIIAYFSTEMQAQGIKISSGVFMKINGNLKIEITNGNFTNNGAYIMALENIEFSGSSPCKINGSGNFDFHNLMINNPQGLTLSGSGIISIHNSLTFINGLVNTGSNYITINDNATVTGASSSGYVNGNCRKIGNDAFIFPVGNNGKYAPIGISAPADSNDHFTASYVKENPNPLYNVSLLGTGLTNVSTLEYWMLDRTNGNSSVTVTLNWDNQSGVSQISDLRVAQWDDTEWRDDGNSGTTGNNSSGTITSNVVNKFSPFTLGSSTLNNPLPIELLYFNAECNNYKVKIKWSTASETNCDYFIVEKMSEGKSFSQIATVQGSGNSNHTINYQIEDNELNTQIAYYRLTQVDYSGVKNIMNNKVAFSNCETNLHNYFVYQNYEESIITINSSDETNADIKIFDLNGKLISKDSKILFIGENNLKMSDFNLSAGIYLMNIQISNYNKSTRIIIK